MGWFLVLSSLLLVSVCTGRLLSLPKQQVCTQDTDCASDECCGIQTGPLIVSKRQALLTGTCKKYVKHNEYCYGQWKQNGACGCEPHMTCKYFPPSTSNPIQAIGKRRPMPGQYLCTPV